MIKFGSNKIQLVFFTHEGRVVFPHNMSLFRDVSEKKTDLTLPIFSSGGTVSQLSTDKVQDHSRFT